METQSEQFERGAQQARARLSGTLEELRARMTPGQVIDQLADFAYQGPAAEFVRNLAREARENPLPLTLIGAGVAWLIIASGLSARARHYAAREPSDIGGAMSAECAYEGAPKAMDREEVGQEARSPDARAMEQAHEQR